MRSENSTGQNGAALYFALVGVSRCQFLPDPYTVSAVCRQNLTLFNIHGVNSLHKRKERSRSQDVHSRSRSRSRSRSPKRQKTRSRAHSYSRSPSLDPTDDAGQVTNTFIRAVAAAVKGQGDDYEESLRTRERSNPKYAFMKPTVRIQPAIAILFSHDTLSTANTTFIVTC